MEIMKKRVLTNEEIEIVKSTIEDLKGVNKWDKSSYAYAIGSLDSNAPHHIFQDHYKKAEIIEKFWQLVPENFWKISNFTTFKNLNF